MAKFIVFDGDFHEIEMAWLKEWEDGENWEDWLPRNGFGRLDLFGVYDEWDDMAPRRISVHAHEKKEMWIVVVSSGSHIFDFIIEGRVNYLRFLSSPLCVTIDLQDDLRAFRATMEKAFTAWHGHPAPDRRDDHSLETSCSSCDPGFDETRQKERERRRKWREERREREEGRERGRRWVAEQRQELEEPGRDEDGPREPERKPDPVLEPPDGVE